MHDAIYTSDPISEEPSLLSEQNWVTKFAKGGHALLNQSTRRRADETYTTYGIRDPRTKKFVYVGQTRRYARRVSDHLRRRKKPAYKTPNVKRWLYEALTKGIKPEFVILAANVSTEQRSLRSETDWVRRLAYDGHPLLNRWRVHRAIIKEAMKARRNETGKATRCDIERASVVGEQLPKMSI